MFLGSWKPGTFEKLGDGGERFHIASTMSATASHLSVQNITLRIEGGPALTDTVLEQIDFAGLQALIAR